MARDGTIFGAFGPITVNETGTRGGALAGVSLGETVAAGGTTSASIAATESSDTATLTATNWTTAQVAANDASDTAALAAMITVGLIANPSALDTFQTAITNRTTAPVVIIVQGDSIGEGLSSSPRLGNRWIDKFRDDLYTKYPVSGVTPPVTSYLAAFFGDGGGSGFTLVGTAPTQLLSQTGLGMRAGQSTTTNSGYELTGISVTSLDIHYQRQAASNSIKVEIDIGAGYVTFATPTLASGAVDSQRWQSGSLGGTATKIKITSQNTNLFVMEGVRLFNGDEAKGFHVIDASHYGYSVADYRAKGATPYQPMALIAPHLVIVPLTENDYFTQPTIANYIADHNTTIASLRAAVANCPVLLISHGLRGDIAVQPVTYSQYDAAQRTICAADSKTAQLKLYGTFPDCTTAPTAIPAEYDTDRVHWTNTGHALAATLTADALATTAVTNAGIAAIDGADTAAITGVPATTASIAATDNPDTAAITAARWTTAQVAATDTGDTAAVTVRVTTGTGIAATDSPDTAAVTANSNLGSTSASIAATDGPDAASVAVTVTTGASIAANDNPDTAAMAFGINWITARDGTIGDWVTARDTAPSAWA